MGSRITKDLRGVAFMHSLWDASQIIDADSTYTENTPRPGSSTTSDLLARAEPQILGAQSQEVTIIGTRAGGFPGIGPFGGAAAYYLDGESVSDARHHRPPLCVTDLYCEGLSAQSDATTTVAFPLSGRVLVGFVDDSTATTLRLWDPDGQAWTSPGTAPSARGAMAVIPRTDRVIWVDEFAGQAWFSDDYGATWSEYAEFETLADTAGSWSHDGVARSMAFDGQGQMVWCAKRTGSDKVRFWTSSDLGLTWVFSVELDAKTASLSAHPSGSVALTYVNASDEIRFVLMGSADDDPTLADSVQILANTDGAEITVVCDEDGAIWHYAYGDRGGLYNECEYRVSWDLGATWQSPNTNSAVITRDTVDTGSASAPSGMSGVAAMGRVFLAHGSTDSGGAVNEHHDTVLVLGGWQGPMFDVSLETQSNSDSPARDPAQRYSSGSIGSTLRALAWNATHPNPTDAQWTTTSTGSGGSTTYTGATGGIVQVIADASTNFRTQSFTITGSHDASCLLRYSLRIIEDQGVSDIRVRVNADTNDFSIRHTDTGIDVYDNDAAAVIGATIAVPDGERLRIEVYFDEDTSVVTVLWQSMESTTDPHGTLMNKETRTLTGSHAATSSMVVEWGRLVGGVGEVQVEWWYFSASCNYQPGNHRAPVLQEGRDGWGRAIDGQYAVALPDVYDADTDRVGRVAMRSGPLMKSETYTHDTAPDYPIEALFPPDEASPYRTWRSVDKSADVVLGVRLDDYDDLVAGAHSWLVMLHRCNFRRLLVEARTSAGSYATIGTVDLATGFTDCSYDLVGRVLRPDDPYSGTAGDRYIAPGELRDGHVILDPTGTPKVRTIETNTGGWWDGTSGRTQARISLSGIDGTETATGDVIIVWPSGVMALHRGTTTPEMQRLRFTIDVSADDAPDAYYEIGALAVFGLHPTGKQWSDGWEWDKTPNVQVTVDSARTETRKKRGPTQRALTLDWSDGFSKGRYRAASPSDSYVADATEDFPLVTQDEVQETLWEWMELSDSFARHVLWCGQVPGDGVTITDPSLWLFGYFTPQGIRAQQATGDEGVDEFLRASGIQIVEAV